MIRVTFLEPRFIPVGPIRYRVAKDLLLNYVTLVDPTSIRPERATTTGKLPSMCRTGLCIAQSPTNGMAHVLLGPLRPSGRRSDTCNGLEFALAKRLKYDNLGLRNVAEFLARRILKIGPVTNNNETSTPGTGRPRPRGRGPHMAFGRATHSVSRCLT